MAFTNEKRKLLDAVLVHVPFDGWSMTTLLAGAHDIGMDQGVARNLFPRGALDMAAAYHLCGDEHMVQRMTGPEFDAMRYSARVGAAIRYRLEAVHDKETVRRSMALFALPQNAAEGSQLVWGTCDKIWKALGDRSDDINWYTKRAILSGVYGSSVLFWLGDGSPAHGETWEFVERRIANVMQFEKLKAKIRDNKGFDPLMRLTHAIFGRVRAPDLSGRSDLPGHWPDTKQGET